MLIRALERAGWDSVRSKNEFEKFRNLALSKGTQSHNWDAAFSVWIERGVEHQAKRKEKQGPIIDSDGRTVRPPPNQKGRGKNRIWNVQGRCCNERHHRPWCLNTPIRHC
jgi:hypothetical protein